MCVDGAPLVPSTRATTLQLSHPTHKVTNKRRPRVQADFPTAEVWRKAHASHSQPDFRLTGQICSHGVLPDDNLPPFASNPSNTRKSPNADLMLGQRRRRWTNIKSALGSSTLFAWNAAVDAFPCHRWQHQCQRLHRIKQHHPNSLHLKYPIYSDRKKND